MLDERVTFALSRVRNIWVGVDAREIEQVHVPSHDSTSGPQNLPVIDLCQVLSVVAITGTDARKVLVMRGLGTPFEVVAGHELRFAEVPHRAICELPEFLRALGQRSALAGFFPIDDAFAYLLDVERLSSLARSHTL